MTSLESLQETHQALRAKLTLLDQQLFALQAAPATINECAESISGLLQTLATQESAIVTRLLPVLRTQPDESVLRFLSEHERRRRTTQALMVLLLKSGRQSADQILNCATNLLAGLREHLAYEEMHLFPVVARLLSDPSATSIATDAERINQPADGPRKPAGPLMTAERRHLDVAAWLATLNQASDESNRAGPWPDMVWQSSDALMVIDEQRRVLAMNPTLERWMGRGIHEVAGQISCGALLGCHDLRSRSLADQFHRCPGLKAMRRATPVTAAEYMIQHSHGRRRSVCASYTPIRAGPAGPVWTLVILRDTRIQKRRENRLMRHAALDPLTRLPDGASVAAFGRKELARAARYGRPLALVVADLDGFRAGAGQPGEPAADALLVDVSHVLRTTCRAQDVLARSGRDEFAFLLPETTAAGAVSVAERARHAIAAFPFAQNARGPALSAVHVALSAGVAVFPKDGITLEALVAQAREQLDKAKRLDRNPNGHAPALG